MNAGRSATILFVCASLLVWLHCAGGTPHYTPNTRWVAELGRDDASLRMGALMTMADGPIIYGLRITPELVAFECRESIVDERSRFGDSRGAIHLLTCPSFMQIRFDAITSIEVSQPDYIVTLRDARASRLFVIKLKNRAQALEMVDIVAWFRDAAPGASAAPALHVELTRKSSLLTDRNDR